MGRAAQPSIEIESELKALIKVADAAFDKQAASLLVPGCSWSYVFEKRAVVSACRQTATSRVEELRIQGLYLPHKGAALPIDVSAHVFFPAPFGKDGGHDAIQAGQGTGVPNLSEPNEINRNGMIFKNGKMAGAK